MIRKIKPRCAPPVRKSRRKITVVTEATTSTTNITGFLAMALGSSLTKAETIAGPTIFGSSIVAAGVCLFVFWTTSMEAAPNDWSEQVIGVVSQVLDYGPEREPREEGESADDEDHTDDEANEQSAGRGECAGRGRNGFLAGE